METIEVGSVFVETWGYDQSNVDCYVVVRTTPKMVALKPCGTTHFGDQVTPDPSNIFEWGPYCRVGKPNANGEVMKRLSSGWRAEAWLNMTSYSGAHLWEGRSYYETPAGMGH